MRDDCADQRVPVREVLIDLRLAGAARGPHVVEGGFRDAPLVHQLVRSLHDLRLCGRSSSSQARTACAVLRFCHGAQRTPTRRSRAVAYLVAHARVAGVGKVLLRRQVRPLRASTRCGAVRPFALGSSRSTFPSMELGRPAHRLPLRSAVAGTCA